MNCESGIVDGTGVDNTIRGEGETSCDAILVFDYAPDNGEVIVDTILNPGQFPHWLGDGIGFTVDEEVPFQILIVLYL